MHRHALIPFQNTIVITQRQLFQLFPAILSFIHSIELLYSCIGYFYIAAIVILRLFFLPQMILYLCIQYPGDIDFSRADIGCG